MERLHGRKIWIETRQISEVGRSRVQISIVTVLCVAIHERRVDSRVTIGVSGLDRWFAAQLHTSAAMRRMRQMKTERYAQVVCNGLPCTGRGLGWQGEKIKRQSENETRRLEIRYSHHVPILRYHIPTVAHHNRILHLQPSRIFMSCSATSVSPFSILVHSFLILFWIVLATRSDTSFWNT
jgi:hypothetical protein